ncbi:hypothetical protein FHG87_014990 [Trinorchestia longiramus]|nr:hypothetical protein FHG87_014990 [Trinorchestia longiramus]
MLLHSQVIVFITLVFAVLRSVHSSSVKRFSRPPNATIDETNITSLLPASYTVMGPNVKASGSYHRASSRTGLAAKTYDNPDHSLGSIFKVHRSADMDGEEGTLSSQPDISSVILSTSTTTSGTTTLSPSLRIRKLREKYPNYQPRFGARLKNASPRDNTKSQRSENLSPNTSSLDNHPVLSKSETKRNEPWVINRPQRTRERTHYRTISSPNPQIVERRSTPSPSQVETADRNTMKKNYRTKFDQILKRPRTPQMQHGNRKVESSSNYKANSADDFDESLDITKERNNPEWSSHPKESSIVQSTQSELNKAINSDFRYSKIKSTTTFAPEAPFEPSRNFPSDVPIKPRRTKTPVASVKPSSASSDDRIQSGREFTTSTSVGASKDFAPVASVEPNRDFSLTTPVESSRAFTPATAFEPSNAPSSGRNKVEDEPEQYESNSNFAGEIERSHAAADHEQQAISYMKSRNEDEKRHAPVYSSNQNRANKWSPNSWEYRRSTHSNRVSRPTTIVPKLPDDYDSSITHKDSSRELFRDDVKKFTATPTKQLQYPRAHHTFHRHFYSDYEEDEEALSSTDQENFKQNARSNIPDWAFDPKWLSSHEILEPYSPPVTTTEKIIARPTIVPGALDVVRRNEFPFEFWQPDNVNFEEDSDNRRREKHENAPPLNFREVPDHLFTVGNGPVAVPEELARNSFETVTAAPSFNLMSNPFQDDKFGRFNPPAFRQSIGEPNFSVPQFEWTSDLEEFESENQANNFGKQSPQAFEYTSTPLSDRPLHNRDVFSGNAAIQKSPIHARQTGVPHLQTTSIPYTSVRIPANSRPLYHLDGNKVPHVDTRTSPNKPFSGRGTNQHYAPNSSHRPKQNFPTHPEKLPGLRPPGRSPQNVVHLNHRHGTRPSKPGGQNRQFFNRPQHPVRGNPHRPQNTLHFNDDPQFSGTSHFEAVNPHNKYSTVVPEYMTRSHFEVKPMDPFNKFKSIKQVNNRHSHPSFNTNNLVYGADPQDEQSLQPYIPPNHYVPQQIFAIEKKKNKPPRVPSKHRQPSPPKKVKKAHDYQSSSIWSALTNFDLNYFNPFGYDRNSPIERVATASALPASVLVPGSLAVLGAGLSLFYFNFVWHPTPVVKARLINVLQNWSHSNVLTVEQQQAIGDVTKVYSALSDLAAKLGALEDRLNSTSNNANVSNHEALVSQPCKNKMVCQTYSEFQDLFKMTKSAATLLGSTLDHLDQEMLLEFLLAADRGHHASGRAGNLTCDDFYPACPLPPISVRETLQDLVGITHVVKDNSLGAFQDVQTSSANLDALQNVQTSSANHDTPQDVQISLASHNTSLSVSTPSSGVSSITSKDEINESR